MPVAGGWLARARNRRTLTDMSEHHPLRDLLSLPPGPNRRFATIVETVPWRGPIDDDRGGRAWALMDAATGENRVDAISITDARIGTHLAIATLISPWKSSFCS